MPSNFDFLLAEEKFASFASKAINAEKTLEISASISAPQQEQHWNLPLSGYIAMRVNLIHQQI
ncbi:MAG: hypothetical protein IJ797_02785 [Selenomonadaceae bacterium]|nr:hypothetical protein [Selenomonadaceae bacterium]